jgi:lysozyme family protein
MSTARFEASLKFVLKSEGSKFTNDPADHGGPTRFGVIQEEYDAFRRLQGSPAQSVQFITMDEVRTIYRREYWERVDGDDLMGPLDLVVFDTAVLMGVKRAIRLLQQALGRVVDGVIGPETRRALAEADSAAVAAGFLDLREERIRGIVDHDPTQERFLQGWLNRLKELRRTLTEPDRPERTFGLEPAEVPAAKLPMGRASLDIREDFGNEGDDVPEEHEPGEDPAAPAPGDLQGETPEALAAARNFANFGAARPPLITAEVGGAPAALGPAGAAVVPTIPLNLPLVQSFLAACTSTLPRITYGLGAKVPFHGAVPGKDFQKVDCSGFVREAIWRATLPHQSFPDGSVVQHDWIRERNFARSSPEAAAQSDGAIRIAFLRPQDSPQRIGHVVLIHNAQTLESHGGVGPDSRPWTKDGWQAKALVYVLTPRTG